MRSTHPSRNRSVDDLTARARIRDAALLQFAEHGIRGATIRGIAAEAGVSAALVQHHFGSKERLREACDAYVLEFVQRHAKEGIDEKGLGDPAFLAAIYQSAPPVVRYLARVMVDDPESATELFDHMVDLTEEYLTKLADDGHAQHSDPRALAAVFVAMRLGVLAFHAHVSRALGSDSLTPETVPRLVQAFLEIVDPRLFGEDLSSLVRRGFERYLQSLPANETEQGSGTTT
ncbi:TetR/AcrR family transcriptional regulator [Actinopolymorpha alba]|uniref:TetR/AcrR family transcriptional regulator n=1 Tax=Actinopolymorpha alba TaxID=533267 RepID=UPI000380208C|nr:TetR/AcrR family transcriptional regulator [Actinopolymorpha alba]